MDSGLPGEPELALNGIPVAGIFGAGTSCSTRGNGLDSTVFPFMYSVVWFDSLLSTEGLRTAVTFMS